MTQHSTKTRSLREACVDEALSIIAEQGLEQLSLREVARRLGVSHQAPYKHYPSRDHLLAEVVGRAFDDFARYLEGRRFSDDSANDLGSIGQSYVRYALKNPLQYRLMFGTPLPDPDKHPEMLLKAQHAFSMLRSALDTLYAGSDRKPGRDELDLEAFYIWSSVHGLASILKSSAVAALPVSSKVLADTTSYTLWRLGSSIRTKIGESSSDGSRKERP
ncbi:TetR/AcrR family transcriptional regulator [Bradyrhizobium sp. WYCCWR 13023]|uniref:TetR/AcrR family transcriptional regulator n=1 Tax=Bradyrhizobium zhengyangense TaxID=2911009 RepID=A0A9X1UJP2_9BRAD|nr:TetR/AcrR family transcriptional regulator [Bradyrhizobium zhengyangense]MCG2631802.1 TetR/AcrR family transcriptional regulator [Bradyrhizobium zhengyangense]